LNRTRGASVNLLKPKARRAYERVPGARSAASKPSSGGSYRVYRFRYYRLHLLRRAALVLMLSLFSIGALIYGTSSAKPTHMESVLPVEAGPLPALPAPPPPRPVESDPHTAPPAPPSLDMDQVWSAAIAQDPSPSLAVPGEPVPSGRKIALTFDDGPDPHATPLILDILRKHDVKATFFVIGRYVAEHPELVRRIVEEGHTLGNHTYNHFDMSYLSPGQMRRELQSTQKAVDEALGYHYPMVLMRPPYGEPYFENPRMLPVFQEVVREQELFVVMWTGDSQDWLLSGQPERIVQNVFRDKVAKRGDENDRVLLLHDTGQQTVDALPEIIDHYNESEVQFTDVNELLTDKYVGE
jgi:peptidoglycan/xylan/chitin deacetylase (PgdA/CDA1 family)